jgi:ATP-dependent DNA helicase RecQ
MIAYAETTGCLRATILRYFGDRPGREPCEACGNCARRSHLGAEELVLVRKILSGIARAGERYGQRKITAMLTGQLEGLPEPLTQLSTTGILRNEEPRTIERWIESISAAGLVRVSDDKYRTLSLTPGGRDVMAGRAHDVSVTVPRASVPRFGRRRRWKRAHPLERFPRGR